MPFEVTIEARSPRDADSVFAEALHPGEFVEAMRGLATYEGLPEVEIVEGMTCVVDVTLFGFLKNPRPHHVCRKARPRGPCAEKP